MTESNNWKTSLVMCVSLLAVSVAVSVRADETSTRKTPPDRAAVEAARKTCESSAGVTEGTRPTREQHEKIRECMKAAGFERPPGGRGGPPPGAPPEPPPSDDEKPISAGSVQ